MDPHSPGAGPISYGNNSRTPYFSLGLHNRGAGDDDLDDILYHLQHGHGARYSHASGDEIRYEDDGGAVPYGLDDGGPQRDDEDDLDMLDIGDDGLDIPSHLLQNAAMIPEASHDDDDDLEYDPTDEDDQDDEIMRDVSLTPSLSPSPPPEPANGRSRGRGRPRGRAGARRGARRNASSGGTTKSRGVVKSRATRPRGRSRAASAREPRHAYRRDLPPRGERERGRKRGAPKARPDPGPEFRKIQGKATEAFLEDDLDTATELCKQAILLNPEIFAPYSLLADISYRNNRPADAIQHLFTGAFTMPTELENWWLIVSRIERDFDVANDSQAIARLQRCYSQILKLDPNNVRARRERLTIYRHLKQVGLAISSSRALIEKDPCDLSALRVYAEMAPKHGLGVPAKEAYQKAISHYQASNRIGEDGFSWRDLDMYLSVLIQLGEYEDAILRLKRVARGHCGRGDEEYWDSWQDDDREWDEEHEPRRARVPQFQHSRYTVDSYGYGLDPTIRAKLGILRLKRGDYDEAMKHFEMFAPDARDSDAPANFLADTFLQVADSLFEEAYYADAVRFYASKFEGVHPTQAQASRYRNFATSLAKIDRMQQAITAYVTLIMVQPGSWQDRIELARLYEKRGADGDEEKVTALVHELLRQNRHKEAAASGLKSPIIARDRRVRYQRIIDLDAARRAGAMADAGLFGELQLDAANDAETMAEHLRQMPMDLRGRKRNKQEELRIAEKSVESNYKDLKAMTAELVAGTRRSIGDWLSTAIVLTDTFLKQHMMRDGATRSVFMATGAGGRERFVDVDYDEWLGIICQTCLLLARYGEQGDAYEILTRADRVPEFHRNEGCMQQRKSCETLCGLLALDEERMFGSLRWQAANLGHLSEVYAVYNLMGRLYPRSAEQYSSGPNQKFWMRHVKSHDFALMSDEQRKQSHFPPAEWNAFSKYPELAKPAGAPERAADCNPEKLTGMDVSLLSFYGNLLAHKGSFSNALGYYMRVYQLRPHDPLTLLLMASCYVQVSMKRTIENRHWDVMTGLGFFEAYAKARAAQGQQARRELRAQYEMEVAFNEGRLMHLLGLSHLAWTAYERCLAVDEGSTDELPAEANYKMEAAYAMQNMLLASGDVEGARQLGERWLVF